MHVVHHFTEIRREGGGVPRAVLDLVRVQAEAGLQVSLLTAEGSELPDEKEVQAKVLEPVRRPLQRLSRSGRRCAAEVLKDADVVHLHGLWRPRNAQIARLARRLGRPVVVSPHGMLNSWGMAQGTLRKALYFRLFERRTLREAAAVHFAAARERDEAARWLPGVRSVVIPLAVDLVPFLELPGPDLIKESNPELAGDVPVILMLGRLHPGKRADLLLEAAAILCQRGVQFRLVFAGRGESAYEGELRALVSRYDLADHVRFLGLVVGREKLSLYQRARVFALPTEHENFGLVFFESLLCGTPVLTTRGADTWRELKESGGVRIVGATFDTTAAAFADQLAELLADGVLCRSMGESGRQWSIEYLDVGRVIAGFRDLYFSL